MRGGQGFRAEHSVVDQILKIVEDVTVDFNKRQQGLPYKMLNGFRLLMRALTNDQEVRGGFEPRDLDNLRTTPS